jgi:hypothetical protein
MNTTEFKTENLAALRELRIQEKALKARIEILKPLAEDEAKLIQPDGGKFTIDGVGDFVLDVNPILEKDPLNPNDTAPDIKTSTSEEAVSYRKLLKEQNAYKSKASSLTKTIKGFYDAFRQKFGRRATRFTYTLKCVGLD